MSEAKNTKTAAASKKKEVKTATVKAPAVKSASKSAAKIQKDAKAVPVALDRLLWLIAFALIAAAIGGNFYYVRYLAFDESSMSRLLRTIGVIAVIAAGLGTVLFTNKGRALLAFAREAYVELRKVVWPTRQESVQTTFIVFVAVCLVSVFLYLCDLIFLQVVRAITL